MTAGEIHSLALQWKWGQKKLDQMEFALAFFKVSTILEPDLIRAYATIDAFCEENGQPLGKNDVWIAATAAVRMQRSSRPTATSTASPRASSLATGSTRTPPLRPRERLHPPLPKRQPRPTPAPQS